MEEDTPVNQAKKAIRHVLFIALENWQVGYHLGLGTQSFSLLTEALATLHGEKDLEKLRRHYCPDGKGVKSHTEIVQELRTVVRDYRIMLARNPRDEINLSILRKDLVDKVLAEVPA